MLGLPAWEHERLIEGPYYDHAADAFEKLEELGALRTIPQPELPSYNSSRRPSTPAPFGRLSSSVGPMARLGDGKEFLRQATHAAAEAACAGACSGRRGVVDVFDRRGGGRRVSLHVGQRHGTPRRPQGGGLRRRWVHPQRGAQERAPQRHVRRRLRGAHERGRLHPRRQGAGDAAAPHALVLGCARGSSRRSTRPGPDRELLALGDSVFRVNKYGDRACNEKTTYNDRTQSHFAWDPARAEYPNFLPFAILERAQTAPVRPGRAPGWTTGGQLHPVGRTERRSTSGAPSTIEELARRCARGSPRAPRAAPAACRLADDFLPSLRETIGRFDGYARSGVDQEFHRGESAIEHSCTAGAPTTTICQRDDVPAVCEGSVLRDDPRAGADRDQGRAEGQPAMQVLDGTREPVPGLYGVGNCVASPSGQAYWSGGSTFGPYVTFGYLAARSIVDEPHKGSPVRGIANAAN